jgi:phage-related protein
MPVLAYNEDADTPERTPKPVRWIGGSKGDVSAFPHDVKLRVGGALWDAQIGVKSPLAKALKGFGDAGVLEVVVDFDGNAFRTVYTIRFAEAVYVLHAFQKKSKRGVATPKAELDLVRARLARAKEDYDQWQRSRSSR